MAGARCVTAVSLKLPSGIPAHTPRHELVTGLLTRAASGYASAAVDENRGLAACSIRHPIDVSMMARTVIDADQKLAINAITKHAGLFTMLMRANLHEPALNSLHA